MTKTDNTHILKEHIEFRYQIIRLAWLDMVRDYRGALLSWIWAVIKPLLQLFAYWFVLKIGLRATISKEGIDLFPWLVVGWAAWFYISGVVSNGVGALKTYKHLVTKIKFPTSVIPAVISLSNLFIHIGLLFVVLLFLAIDGSLSIYWLQLPLYIILMAVFAIFWNMFSAPLGAISRDFTQLVKSGMRILFWLSGVIYNIHTIDIEWLKAILRFNPFSFFIEGYRNTLLYGRWFWEDWKSLAAFGVVFAIVIFLGIHTHKRTRKELADVL